MILFTIFLTLISKSEELTEQNIVLLEELIRHYSIDTIYYMSESPENLDIFAKRFENQYIKLNIDTKDTHKINFGYNDIERCCEMLLIVATDSNSLGRIIYWIKVMLRTMAKLIVVSLPKKILGLDVAVMFRFSQILFIMDGEIIKRSHVANISQPFTTAKEFIETDPYEAPELYLPKIYINYRLISKSNFPLLVGKGQPTSGLIFYFKSAFEKYYEDIRNGSN